MNFLGFIFEESTLTDDVEIVDAFTNGDCWRLALSLNSLAGLPIYAVCSLDCPRDTWCHVFNQLPDGSFIDIMGIHSESEMLSKWECAVYEDNVGIAALSRENLDGVEIYSDKDPDEWAVFLMNKINNVLAA